MPRNKFITVFEYGSGGAWQYVHADARDQILAKYPKLTVLDVEPAWFKERILSDGPLREYDIDDEPDDIMRNFAES